MRGCYVYIPAEELQRAGIDPYSSPPFYRVWGRRRGSILIQLYAEQ